MRDFAFRSFHVQKRVATFIWLENDNWIGNSQLLSDDDFFSIFVDWQISSYLAIGIKRSQGGKNSDGK